MPKKLIKYKSTSEKKQNRGKNQNLKKYPKIKGKIKFTQQNKQKIKWQLKNYSIKMYQYNKMTDTQNRKNNENQSQRYQWSYEKAQNGTSVLHNTSQSNADFEEEQKNKSSILKQTYQYKDDYFYSGSINYKGNEYNQRNQQEKQQEEYQNNIKNFKEMQQANTQAQQTQQRQQNYRNYESNLNQNQNRERQQEQYQTRRNYREQRSPSTQSRYSETNSYRTRNSRSNSRSNSRVRRNNNYGRNRRNNRYYNNENYNNRNNRKQFYRNQQERNKQEKNEEKSITNEMLKEQEKIQEQTCRYWQKNTCRNHECERKHYQMIKLMNMYYQPKSKRIKNNITDYNSIEKEIQKQEFTVQIEITRQMKIEEIQKFIVQQSKKLDQKRINNIKIRMAVKNNRKITQEIEHIRNTTLLEVDKETVNLTQAELIATSKVLKEIQKQEFINIKETFIERNSEQEYQNQIFREKHMKQIEQLQEQKQYNDKQMEVEDNNIRISFSTNIFKSVIQETQFSNIIFGEQNQQKRKNTSSEEDKVNKQNTSSGEEQNKIVEELRISQNMLQSLQEQQQKMNESIPISTQKQEKNVNRQNVQVDTSQAIIQSNVHLLKESLLIIEENKNIKDIAFLKLNNKQLFKEYLTEQQVDTNKEAKEIPTGAYLILLIDANYINIIKQRIKQEEDKNTLQTRITAFAEAISTHAISTVQSRLESDKIKLDSSRKPITSAVNEIISSEAEYTQEYIQQIRMQTNQAINVNVIIQITFKFEICKAKMEQLKKKDQHK